MQNAKSAVGKYIGLGYDHIAVLGLDGSDNRLTTRAVQRVLPVPPVFSECASQRPGALCSFLPTGYRKAARVMFTDLGNNAKGM